MVGVGYGERGRVLVVDDDPGICLMVVEMLNDLGLEGAYAHSEGGAQALLPSLPPFRALIVDVELGHGVSGFDVADFAGRVIPDLAVIYMSGGVQRTEFAALGMAGGAFLQKPFTADDLHRLLGPMLEP